MINRFFGRLYSVLRFTVFTCCFTSIFICESRAQTTGTGGAGASSTGVFSPVAPAYNGSGADAAGNTSVSPAPTPTAARMQDVDITPVATPQKATPQSSTVAAAPAPITDFQRIVAGSTGRLLPIFGANLFTNAPSTFAPVDNIPVTPDYVIGPGDELRLQVWGQVNQHGSFIVDRTGSISLPDVGTIHVAGLQFSQITDFIRSQLGRVYRNFDLNVNLGQLRSIQIFIAGQVIKPGNYTVSSLSTLLNAIFASGGPLPQGSLRDIQLKRGNQTVTRFDLYDLLLQGDKSKDVRLEPGDVIFVPTAGPQVAVLGSVTSPAIYELRAETTFNQVLELAGGLTNAAIANQLRVERIADHSHRSELNINLTTTDNPRVQDGDIITAGTILDRFQNAVTLRGNVASPGRYVWQSGMRISDLIPNRDALITRNYYDRHDQLGQTSQNDRAGVTGALGVQSSPDTSERTATGGGGNSVGAALTANSSSFTAANDVVLSAPDIDWDYAVIERQDRNTLKTSLLPFNLGKVVIDHDPSQDLELLNGDIITIFSKADIRVPNVQQTKFVRLEGEFLSAGVYSVLPGETLRQLLTRVGGLTPDAYLYASEFTRDAVRRVEKQRLTEYANSLEEQITANTGATTASAITDRDAAAAQASATQSRAIVDRLRQAEPSGRIVFQLKPDAMGIAEIPDMALEDGDRFIVPRKPASVYVQGQVYNANAFLFVDGRHAGDYLRLAGGPDRTADSKREFILRADGSVVSRQNIDTLGHRALFADNAFENVKLQPGDTIIVPPIIEKGSVLRNLTNIATILEGFGISAAAVQVLK